MGYDYIIIFLSRLFLMEPQIVENYETAAKVHGLCRKAAAEFIHPGVKLLDVAEEIESLTKKHGCGIAFPLNLSLNDIAAHYTPSEDDETIVQEGDVLKVDIGVHKNGYLVDAAITLPFSKDPDVFNLVQTTHLALEEAFKIAKEGIEVRKIGKKIEEVMRAHHISPIENLSGHGVDQYTAHCPPTIPNVDNGDSTVLENDGAYAIEPFGSIHGNGSITDSPHVEIFEVANQRTLSRNSHARSLLEFCVENYHGLPFAERWIARDLDMSAFQRKTALRELVKHDSLTAHPVLKEKKGAIVSQFETTILINNGKILRLV